MASAAANVSLWYLTPAELRQWVEDHPGHIEDRDKMGETALSAAAGMRDLALVQWLTDDRAADVNARVGKDENTLLHATWSVPIMRLALERNADPTLLNNKNRSALMLHTYFQRDDCIACLLEDKRVVATINERLEGGPNASWPGCTTLHIACLTGSRNQVGRAKTLRLLVEAGADPEVRDGPNGDGETPMQVLRSEAPVDEAAVAVLEEGVDAKRAAALLRVRWLMFKDRGVTLSHALVEEGSMTVEEEALLAFVVGLGEKPAREMALRS